MLAPVERYTTIGVFGWQIKNTQILPSVPNFLANQKRRETLLSLLLIFGQEERKRGRLGFNFVTQNWCWSYTMMCRILTAAQPYFSLK